MDQDLTFRTVLIVGFLFVFPIALYYRLRSQATGERLDRRQEGLFILVTSRSAGIVLWLGVIVYMIDPAWMSWSSVPMPPWLRWTGTGVWAIAGVLLLWTLSNLGKNLTDTVVTRREHTLVTNGPYRLVRHPFYDAVFLTILAISLVAANWFFVLMGSLLFLLLLLRTRTEEERLLARFGDGYQAYMERTGRFLPKL